MSSEQKKPRALTEFDGDKTSIDGNASDIKPDTKADEITAKIKSENRSSLDDAFEARTVVTSRPSAISDDETSPGLAKQFIPASAKPAAMPPLVTLSPMSNTVPSSIKNSRPLPPMEDSLIAESAEMNAFDQVEEIPPRVNFFATRNGRVAAAVIGIVVFAVILKSVMHREDAEPVQVKAQPVVEVPLKVQPKAPELRPPPPSTAAVLDQFDISFARTQAQAQK
jgi:hypothetical protein